MVVVQGDTTTAMAAAMAAFYRRIPVAHVEAGLRTTDPGNPFPEEMNRRVITRLSSLHFAPTEGNREALLQEGVPEHEIVVTGNPGIDALLRIAEDAPASLDSVVPDLADIVRDRKIVLLTTHRRENFGAAQREILEAVGRIVEAHDDVAVLFPVHPNPAVLAAVRAHLRPHPRLCIVPPFDYVTFARLMSHAYLILTDSGGIQEEAPALGVPVLVLRSTTERSETIAAGNARLVELTAEAILAAASQLLDDIEAHRLMSVPSFPFGDGRAGERIVEAMALRVGGEH